MALRAAPTPIDALRGSTGRRDRKQDVRGEVADLRVQLRARSDEERVYVQRTRDGLLRIWRAVLTDDLTTVERLASTGVAHADRRLRQLDTDGGDAA